MRKSIITSIGAFSLLTATSQASVYCYFTQQGNDVLMSFTGSFDKTAPPVQLAKTCWQGSQVGENKAAISPEDPATTGSGNTATPQPFVTAPGIGAWTLTPGAPAPQTILPPIRTRTNLSKHFGVWQDGSLTWHLDYGEHLQKSDSVYATALYLNRTLAEFTLSASTPNTVV